MALISKQIVRKIESELYAYPQNMKTLNEQRDDIMNGSHYPDVSVSGGEMGNTTQSKGMRLAQLETGWTDLITEMIPKMPGEYRALVKGIYFEHKRVTHVADELHISQSLCYAWKDNLIFYIVLMATQKHLLNPFLD
ncbi:MAG: hypothetical protein P4L49_02705 [Desulfosporosinus sp.]|nr:hypothetical protein [Desulfosporosinus sp.]